MTAQGLLTLSCEDRPGIVAEVAGTLSREGANILEAQQFGDEETGRFFLRVVFAGDLSAVRGAFAPVAERFSMDWTVRDPSVPARVLILVSKFDHCLIDLLYRQRIGELKMDVVAIASNHPKDALAHSLADDVPFHHLPVTAATKEKQEAQIRTLIEETGAELVVLARYMQILSDEMAAYLAGRCINIHHSFLPGFKGARPYHQAHARGVKMIGATAHYVTGDLDEGPILAQDVEPITHADSPGALIAKGRDIERRVLARAVQAHLEGRAFLNGSKTVVFSD
ncbi:formyltetrahydrofolate deformylase [Parvularcula dongshanensis]|uniref:Formyltetrahydrofolate deformylase n=1 Tax=Parvularcula dongshanensis TaxID=1173995 RepID=A0A840I480_9PROT|nr:formyltetrahydrofolate deformylase [Parvularcula dongshanensis]MBB4659073.1 formyltetrahydrofolate deformylase [Parvularcula dongshanensis]